MINAFNNEILEEYTMFEVISSKKQKYEKLPRFVKVAIPFEECEEFFAAIDKAKRYNKKEERIAVLHFILGTPSVKGWLAKMDIFTVVKEQAVLDSLAKFVSLKLQSK